MWDIWLENPTATMDRAPTSSPSGVLNLALKTSSRFSSSRKHPSSPLWSSCLITALSSRLWSQSQLWTAGQVISGRRTLRGRCYHTTPCSGPHLVDSVTESTAFVDWSVLGLKGCGVRWKHLNLKTFNSKTTWCIMPILEVKKLRPRRVD